MTTNLGRFITTTQQLIDNLLETYRNHDYFYKEISLFNQKFNLIKKTNPKKCLEGFLVYVYPYKNEIMQENENFFLGHDYRNDTNNEGCLIKSLKIKELWKDNISPDTKSVIFTFFKVLIIISEKCVSDNINKNNNIS